MYRHLCPVCKKHFFTEEYEECPICNWVNDEIQEEMGDIKAENPFTLSEARELYKTQGRLYHLDDETEKKFYGFSQR